jgi:Carboxypeptidase regulatory-like domain
MKKIVIIFTLLFSFLGFSQVTKSSISGVVKSEKGATIPGASVLVVHTPTGTKYSTSSDFDGSYAVPAIRPGGPYTVKVTFMGYKSAEVNEVNANLGSNVTVNVVMVDELSTLKEVVVKGKSGGSAFSKNRTGASQQFSTREINAVPVIGSRSVSSITKYNANAGKDGTFGGQDARLNSFTIDGSVFNNGFGLSADGVAGSRTGTTAISLDAIEQIQVNIAPFDVRQSGFIGAGTNAVTRSGSNDIEGSVYTSFRDNTENFSGTKAGKVKFEKGVFKEKINGVRIGFPIIKNKLFFFGNAEMLDNTSPATTFTTSNASNRGAQVSAPTTEQMQELSDFLKNKFQYETGPFANYNAVTESKKFLARIDWNINDNNKLTARYVHHDSSQDQLTSNSNSLGFGNRRTNATSLSFKNSGYIIKDNTRSFVLELDSKLSETWNNNFIAGYDYQNEDRALQGGGLFPTIDIKNGEETAPNVFSTSTASFIAAGLDPFTQANKLDYTTFHITNNLTKKAGSHTYVMGLNYENFISNNTFYSGSNGVYVFNSLKEFYNAANQSISLGGAPSTTLGTSLPIRTQYKYSLLPGKADPLQVLKSNKFDLYAQDEYKVDSQLKLTYGIRATAISFSDTALENPAVTAMTFANGEKFNTGEMPDTQFLFEPRFGFNLDVTGDSKTQVRGGTGIFTAKPPLVYVSNAIGNNGVLFGVVDASGDAIVNGNNGQSYGFTTNPEKYFSPTTAAPNYELAFTAKDYKFPQSWKTTVALDQKLPLGLVGTIEGVFSKNINEVFYRNANLANPIGRINDLNPTNGSNSGDTRPFYSGTDFGSRINNTVSSGVVLDNSNKGYFYSTTIKLEYPYKNGIWGSIAYTRSDAYDLVSPGSIAFGSWTSARSVNGNNNLDLSLSNNNTPHRIVGILGYKLNYGKNYGGSTSINIGYIGEQSGAFSYTYNNDINGDRVNGNDLLFIPNKASDLRFAPITQNVGGVTQTLYTEAQQQEAFDKYIDQDPYLSTRRGQYAERNSNVLPMLHRLDLSITQDFYIKIAGKKNSFQFRADILNFGNLLNRAWGVSQRAPSTNILSVSAAPSSANNYTPVFTMQTQIDEQGKRFLSRDTFVKNASDFDVWQTQFTLRYTFGK